MSLSGVEGWGWLLFVAVLFAPCSSVGRSGVGYQPEGNPDDEFLPPDEE